VAMETITLDMLIRVWQELDYGTMCAE
jgi:hypothetical protein